MFMSDDLISLSGFLRMSLSDESAFLIFDVFREETTPLAISLAFSPYAEIDSNQTIPSVRGWVC